VGGAHSPCKSFYSPPLRSGPLIIGEKAKQHYTKELFSVELQGTLLVINSEGAVSSLSTKRHIGKYFVYLKIPITQLSNESISIAAHFDYRLLRVRVSNGTPFETEAYNEDEMPHQVHHERANGWTFYLDPYPKYETATKARDAILSILATASPKPLTSQSNITTPASNAR